jgi:hypothetical protein
LENSHPGKKLLTATFCIFFLASNRGVGIHAGRKFIWPVFIAYLRKSSTGYPQIYALSVEVSFPLTVRKPSITLQIQQ